MSNRVCLEATEFSNPVSGDKSFGFRIYDDYDKAYCNTLEVCPADDLELLKVAVEMDTSEISQFFDFLAENEKGIYINDEWYDWEQIKDILAKGVA